MSERTKRAAVIVAAMAFMLAMAALGYWLGRGSAPRPQAPKTVAATAQDLSPAASTEPIMQPVKPRNVAAAKTAIVVAAASIPPKWRLAGVSQYQTATNTQSWLQLYADHIELIREFNGRHPFAWNVHSPEEIAWLARNGFPMPEDIIAAASMSDNALRLQGDAGSAKAQMLYYERLQSEWSDAIQTAIEKGASVDEARQAALEAMPEIQPELDRISLGVRQMDTPYFGYVEANRVLLAVDEDARAQNFAGGMALAYARGDDRAGLFVLSASASSNGKLSDGQAALAFRIMSEMRDYFPVPGACDPRISTPFPKPTY